LHCGNVILPKDKITPAVECSGAINCTVVTSYCPRTKLLLRVQNAVLIGSVLNAIKVVQHQIGHTLKLLIFKH